MAEPVQAAVYRDLIARMPRTFGPAFKDQLAQWDLLFPAEQRQLRAQIDWLSRLPAPEFKTLFAPITDLESSMDLPGWEPGSKGLSVYDSGVLARSPLYSKWRQAVEKVFSAIDAGAGATAALPPAPRLIACVLPPGLPPARDPLWPEFSKQGTWIALDRPVSSFLAAWVASLAARRRRPDLEDVESTWIIECEGRFKDIGTSPAAVVLDWTALDAARREFLNRLNTIRRDLKSVDETNAEIRRADISRLVPQQIAARPRVREFVRNLLLSGNGSLVFPNSFVQWGAAEIIRRAQPQVLLAMFGMRQKLKPFSSTVLFEDQHRANPTPDEDDLPGSLVDGQILAEYVYLAAARSPAYQSHTLGVMALAGLDRVLLTGELPDGLRGTMRADDFALVLMRWLESGR